MDRMFDEVFVRPPGRNYFRCKTTNPAGEDIDLTLARKQHAEYVSILRESGIAVNTLSPSDELPDAVFMEDVGLLVSDIAIIGRFGEPSRRGEEEVLLRDLGRKFQTRRIVPNGTLEGGDILVTEHAVFVGLSSRTNEEGIRQLKSHLSNLELKPVPTRLMHLLSGVTYLTERMLVICPSHVQESSFPGFEFIKIPQEELYAANTLYLGDNKVLIPQGYPKTRAKLTEGGFEPIELNISEFWKGDGALTCLSLPVHRIEPRG